MPFSRKSTVGRGRSIVPLALRSNFATGASACPQTLRGNFHALIPYRLLNDSRNVLPRLTRFDSETMNANIGSQGDMTDEQDKNNSKTGYDMSGDDFLHLETQSNAASDCTYQFSNVDDVRFQGKIRMSEVEMVSAESAAPITSSMAIPPHGCKILVDGTPKHGWTMVLDVNTGRRRRHYPPSREEQAALEQHCSDASYPSLDTPRDTTSARASKQKTKISAPNCVDSANTHDKQLIELDGCDASDVMDAEVEDDVTRLTSSSEHPQERAANSACTTEDNTNERTTSLPPPTMGWRGGAVGNLASVSYPDSDADTDFHSDVESMVRDTDPTDPRTFVSMQKKQDLGNRRSHGIGNTYVCNMSGTCSSPHATPDVIKAVEKGVSGEKSTLDTTDTRRSSAHPSSEPQNQTQTFVGTRCFNATTAISDACLSDDPSCVEQSGTVRVNVEVLNLPSKCTSVGPIKSDTKKRRLALEDRSKNISTKRSKVSGSSFVDNSDLQHNVPIDGGDTPVATTVTGSLSEPCVVRSSSTLPLEQAMQVSVISEDQSSRPIQRKIFGHRSASDNTPEAVLEEFRQVVAKEMVSAGIPRRKASRKALRRMKQVRKRLPSRLTGQEVSEAVNTAYDIFKARKDEILRSHLQSLEQVAGQNTHVRAEDDSAVISDDCDDEICTADKALVTTENYTLSISPGTNQMPSSRSVGPSQPTKEVLESDAMTTTVPEATPSDINHNRTDHKSDQDQNKGSLSRHQSIQAENSDTQVRRRSPAVENNGLRCLLGVLGFNPSTVDFVATGRMSLSTHGMIQMHVTSLRAALAL